MQTKRLATAAVYIKETLHRPQENTHELQEAACIQYCQEHEIEIVATYHDPPGSRHDFQWMIGAATQEGPPFDHIVVRRSANLTWSLEEMVHVRDLLKRNGVSIIATTESTYPPF